MRLQNKVAIITGSTSGIGEAAAKLFAKEGASVIVTGRRTEKGLTVVRSIKEKDGEAHFIQADITDDGSYDRIVEETLSKYGKIDILINNAGRIIEKPFLEFSESDWNHFIKLDAFAYFRMMQEVLPAMVKQNSGNIINVTSLAAINVLPTHALYSFVKAGITQMSKVVAAEFASKNIRVNNLLPGVVYTEMIEDNPNTPNMEKIIPIGRMSTADEQAEVLAFLASDQSSYITGTSIVADGGIRGL